MHTAQSYRTRYSERAGAKSALGLAGLRGWWQRASDADRRNAVAATGWISTAAVGLVAMLAVMPGQYTANRTSAEYDQTVKSFAASVYGDGQVDAVAADASRLDQDWLTRVSEAVVSTDETGLAELARYETYVEGLETLDVSSTRSLYTSAEAAMTEHECLATAIYYEARSESLSGQLAVAEVIANRVADARYPNSVCDVVFQGSSRNIGCQFTFTCDGALARKPRGIRWERAKSVAAHVTLDLHERRTNGATHYHADYVDPIWNAGLVKTRKIGTHIFYRFPRGREWAQYRAALAEKRANRLRVIQTVADTTPPADQGIIAEASAAPAP